jgi:hypothetical protein
MLINKSAVYRNCHKLPELLEVLELLLDVVLEVLELEDDEVELVEEPTWM